MVKKERQNLEQYYTDPKFLQFVVSKIKKKIDNWDDLCWIDFSAGNNDFLKTLKPSKKYAFDLEPRAKGIKKMDWFNVKKSDVKCGKKEIAIGFNPPYGKRAILAHNFVNHAVQQFNPEYLILLSPISSFTFLHSKYKIVFKKMIREPIFYTINTSNNQRSSFHFSVPFVILQRRERVIKPRKCKSKYYNKIKSENYFEGANFMVYTRGRGSVGRNILVRNEKTNMWDFYRNGIYQKSVQSYRDLHFSSVHTFHSVQLKPDVSGKKLAQEFLKYFNEELACERTPCNMSVQMLCNIINNFGRKNA